MLTRLVVSESERCDGVLSDATLESALAALESAELRDYRAPDLEGRLPAGVLGVPLQRAPGLSSILRPSERREDVRSLPHNLTSTENANSHENIDDLRSLPRVLAAV